MKLNNKILIAILAGLALIYFATNYLKKHNSKTSLKTDIIAIDTSQVSKISIQKLTAGNDEIIFSKNSKDWQVSQGTINSKTKKGSVLNLLKTLQELKIERLVAKTKDKWNTYQLIDSLATIVTIEQGTTDKKTILYLGKTKYNPPTNQYNQYNLSGSTYIRVNSDPAVYTVKGLLSNTFTNNFNSWRNSDFLKVNKNSVTKIQFDYPEEENFTLSKRDSIWNIDKIVADSTKIAQYLSTISYKNNSKFADTFTPKRKSDYKIRIEGDNMNETIIEAYKDTVSNKFYLTSTMNPQVFFESDSIGMFKQLFLSKDHFIE